MVHGRLQCGDSGSSPPNIVDLEYKTVVCSHWDALCGYLQGGIPNALKLFIPFQIDDKELHHGRNTSCSRLCRPQLPQSDDRVECYDHHIRVRSDKSGVEETRKLTSPSDTRLPSPLES
jgi:hypothetical protein